MERVLSEGSQPKLWKLRGSRGINAPPRNFEIWVGWECVRNFANVTVASFEGLHRREVYAPISLKFFKLLGICWNLACRLFLSQKNLHVFFHKLGNKASNTYGQRRGRGGWILAQFCPYFSAFLKKKQWHFLTQKQLACQISNFRQLEKLQWNRYIRLPSTEPFIWNEYVHKENPFFFLLVKNEFFGLSCLPAPPTVRSLWAHVHFELHWPYKSQICTHLSLAIRQ